MAEPPSKPSTALVRIGEEKGHTIDRMSSWTITCFGPSRREVEAAARAMVRDDVERLRVDRQSLDAGSADDQLQESPLTEAGQSASEIEAEEARRMKLIRRVADMRRGL